MAGVLMKRGYKDTDNAEETAGKDIGKREQSANQGERSQKET